MSSTTQIRGDQIPSGLQPEVDRIHGPRLRHGSGRWRGNDDQGAADHRKHHRGTDNSRAGGHHHYGGADYPCIGGYNHGGGANHSWSCIDHHCVERSKTPEVVVQCAQRLLTHTWRSILRKGFRVEILRQVAKNSGRNHRYTPFYVVQLFFYFPFRSHRLRSVRSWAVESRRPLQRAEDSASRKTKQISSISFPLIRSND